MARDVLQNGRFVLTHSPPTKNRPDAGGSIQQKIPYGRSFQRELRP
ncbi:MAG: hypothetical protein IT327_21995 [Anaerolineae bacterium]|nr:hypothetical protein [Anaerolineae bacterium]